MAFRKGVFVSKCICSDADRELEETVNAKLKELGIHGRLSVYSMPKTDGTTTYGVIFTLMGKSNQEERDRPFIADEILARAEQQAPMLAALARPQWTGEAGHLPATHWPSPQELAETE